MDNQQLLQAIAQMMDEKVDSLRKEMTRQNDETRKEMTKLDEKLTRQNNETRALVEQGYQKIYNLLKEDYGRVSHAVAKVSDYDEVKSQVSMHEHALERHNARLVELEKKVI